MDKSQPRSVRNMKKQNNMIPAMLKESTVRNTNTVKWMKSQTKISKNDCKNNQGK
jgi:hypothetical protein